ncbi:16S rRNA (guanine(527)-N(7))-methyltransferase RsmG [Cutibacterium sp. WCA-380-WT-3A]|uniref:Ribosomal RNA small subunit methyltransferase G n=1 Tax=Cutibacterium porci TaxID=2605781 RepID=A0A7K0J422_9ACTN|nr:16S rRNA (guanine(527)-N(7))-methyltransferase RsmG [Cutibacterium porci]MSS44672.1 16S rRNA (guanine(527)-N(7))-methyltransferase RsmG [Cutibacterium porci]
MSGMTLVSDDDIAEKLYRDNYKTIQKYVDILASRGVDWGLIGPREVDRLWERHILNSAALESLIPKGCRVADVGSGAGLPGIPLAILRPDLEMTLVEPMLRRSNFLTESVDELGLGSQVTVVRERAEDADLDVDVVVSRAVAKLVTLVAWTADLIAGSGCLLALKGQSAEDEVAKARKELLRRRLSAEVLLVRADPASEVTRAVRVRRLE